MTIRRSERYIRELRWQEWLSGKVECVHKCALPVQEFLENACAYTTLAVPGRYITNQLPFLHARNQTLRLTRLV